MFSQFLVLVLAFLYSAAAQGPSHIFVSAPNIIRVGNVETVLVNVFNTEAVSVTVSLKNGDDSEIFPPTAVEVSPDEPEIVRLFVDPARVTALGADEDFKQYAKVVVVCEELNFRDEKEILISYEEGFVFIQTDKPIYTPDQKVNIRLLILDQYMRPSNKPVRIDVLTPQDVIVHRISDIVSENGFKTHVFAFPHEPLFGNWSVVAYYGTGLKANRSVQFEVKEYVLPTFSVQITPPKYILEGAEAFDCSLNARYVYNKPVQGTFYAKIGILGLDGEIEIKDKKEGQILRDGSGHFRVRTSDLGENWFEENVGKRLYLEVSVLEAASGHSENASDVSAKFVRSPYTFSWRRTVQYYKKGLPYEVKVDLLYTNDKVAPDVPVEVIAKGFTPDGQEQLLFGEESDDGLQPTLANTNAKGQVNFRLYVCPNCDRIHIKLQTKDNELVGENGVDNNAKLEFDVSPFDSPTGSDYLLIRLTQQFVDVGRRIPVEALVQTTGVVPHLAYFVITKGHIVQANVLNHNIPNLQGFQIRITYDMVPTARIVAYYINQHGQVISDSLWIEVERSCENRVSVRVGGNHRAGHIFHPADLITLQVDALPQTTVGLLAVDKAVLLLQNYHQLTQDKMYQTMDSYDSGCGPGGGRDSPDVFKNAGVTVLSSANLDVSRREEYACATPTNRRRRRSLESQRQEYSDFPVKNYACKRGHKLVGESLTCQERSERFLRALQNRFPDVTEESEITEAQDIFILCCETAERAQEPNRGRFGLGQDQFVNLDIVLDDPEDISVRSDFRETWIFQEVQVGEDGFIETDLTIPSSITQWAVSAVGLSQNYAMCVAAPLEITVRSDLFIQLHMPYSVVRMEQVEIVATVFNYGDFNLDVTVFLQTNEKVCSEGTANVLSAEKTFRLDANSAYSVKYVVIGLEVGEHPIKVVALAAGPTDGIEKVLRVVAEGVEVSFHHSAILDPSGSQSQPALGREPLARAGHSEFRVNELNNPEENHQVNIYDIRLPPNTVPNSEKCEVSVIGNVLGPVITTVIDGLESLLALPRGCGEQTMIYMAPNVYVLRYLTSVSASSAALEQKARSNINEGILREMVHRHSDGSFSVWGTNPNYPSSTWLTAFVNKVFCHASEFEYVDSKVTCSAIEWLISTQRDGAFTEGYRVHHREMTGGVQGDATLTAFVLISIHECECAALSNKTANATSNAVSFLEDELDNIVRPYALAIVTYALALVGSPRRHDANLMLKSMETFDPVKNTRFWGADPSSLDQSSQPYWYRVRPTAIMVETTGYALLAQLALNDISYSHAIVRWLSEQQNYGGGFASTQDTTIALQALAEYAVLNDGEDLDMTCRIEHEDGYEEQFHFTPANALVQRHATPPAKGHLSVHSEGRGTGKVNVEVKYNVIANGLLREECPFKIDINAREPRAGDLDGGEDPPEDPFDRPHIDDPRSRIGDGRSRIGHIQKRQASGEANRGALIVVVRIRVGYFKNEPTSMGIIDVGIYSGFVPIEDDLEQIVQENEYISRYEVSQRSVIFYADNIPPVDQHPQLEFEFHVRRDIIVGNIQPVAVKVYDYYNPTEECVKFYHPLSGSPLLETVCEGDVCICAAGGCVACGEEPREVLLQRSCISAQTYVYQVLVTDKRQEGGFSIITASVKQILKRADDVDIMVDDVREFWSSASCPCPRMRENNLYLVIGEKSLAIVTRTGEDSFKYVLDSEATVEFWPTRRRRRTKDQFDKMADFQIDMETGRNGCQ